MTGAVFTEMLRRKWRNMFYWGLGLGIYALYPFLILPSDPIELEEFLGGYADVLDNFDPAMIRAIGVVDVESFGTAAGFIGYGFFGFMLLVLAVYAVLAGLNVTANEEDDGVSDVLLSLPIPRWRIVIEKALAYALMVTGVSVMAFLGLQVGNILAPLPLEVSKSRLFEGTLNFIPSTLFLFAFTVFVSTLVRRKSTAAGISGVFVIASYMLDSVGRAADSDLANNLRQLSVFSHYNGTTVLNTGLVWSDVLGLLAVSALFVIGAVFLFNRRDIAV